MRPLLTLLAVLVLGTLARAQVTDGSTWTDSSGNVATCDVADTDSNPANVTVSVTDSTGFTSATTATASSGSTAEKPKAQSTEGRTMSTNSPQPNTYRVKDGKLQKKVKDKWVNMTKTKKSSSKSKKLARFTPTPWDPPGRFAPNAPPPADQGVLRSTTRQLSPGEEGGSLPGPGSGPAPL